MKFDNDGKTIWKTLSSKKIKENNKKGESGLRQASFGIKKIKRT